MRKRQSTLAGVLGALACVATLALGATHADTRGPRSSTYTPHGVAPIAARSQSTWTPVINPGARPLKIYYKASIDDYAAVVTQESEKELLQEGYVFVRNDGLILPFWNAPGAVALTLIRCQTWVNGVSREAYQTTTASPSAHRCAVVREEGVIFTDPAPDRMELVTYWNGVKRESATGAFLATETLYRNDGLAPGHIEGYIPRTDPDSGWRQLRSFWYGVAEDHLTAAGAGLTAITGYEQAIRTGVHSYVRDEGFLFTSPTPGMVPVYAYYRLHQRPNGSTRFDYFLGATSQAAADAAALGYAIVTIDGFCYATQQPDTVPLKRYWHAGRGDYFTLAAAASEAAAVANGYQNVGTECFVPLTQPPQTLRLRRIEPGVLRRYPKETLPTLPSTMPTAPPSIRPPM